MPGTPFGGRSPGPARSPSGPTSQFGPAARSSLYVYELRPTFGAYLQRLRGNRSLREVAVPLGLNHTMWRRMERGEASLPSPDLLRRIAAAFSRPVDEVFAEAGVRARNNRSPRQEIDDVFRALALHPDLVPAGMDEEWLEAFSTRQKEQIIEMLCKAGQMVLAKKVTPTDLVSQVRRQAEEGSK